MLLHKVHHKRSSVYSGFWGEPPTRTFSHPVLSILVALWDSRLLPSLAFPSLSSREIMPFNYDRSISWFDIFLFLGLYYLFILVECIFRSFLRNVHGRSIFSNLAENVRLNKKKPGWLLNCRLEDIFFPSQNFIGLLFIVFIDKSNAIFLSFFFFKPPTGWATQAPLYFQDFCPCRFIL